MPDVDLIPAEYARLQRLRRSLRRFLLAGVALMLIIGAAFLALGLASSSERSSIAGLEQQKQAWSRSRAETDGYRQQKLRAAKQLAELDELRSGERIALLLRAIDAAYNDGVWLDELHLVRRDPSAREAPGAPGATPAPVGAPSGPAAEAGQRVELVGHASKHSRLAEFMRTLGSQPGIAEIRLLDSAIGADDNAAVIDLTLTLRVAERQRP